MEQLYVDSIRRCRIAPIKSIAFNLDVGYSNTINETERRKLNMTTTTTFDSVGDLKSRLQTIFSMYTPTEIADGTGIPLGTVKNYKYKRSDLSQMPLATVEEVFRWQSENEPSLGNGHLIKMTKDQVEALYGPLDYDKEIIIANSIFLQRLITSAKSNKEFEERAIIVNPQADGNYLTGNMGRFGTLTHAQWYNEVVSKVVPKLRKSNYFYPLFTVEYGYPKHVSPMTYEGRDFVRTLPVGLLKRNNDSTLRLNVIEVVSDESELTDEEQQLLNELTFNTSFFTKAELEDIEYPADSTFVGKYDLFKSLAQYISGKEHNFWSGVFTGNFLKLFAIPVFMDAFLDRSLQTDLYEFIEVYVQEVLLSDDRGDLEGFGTGDHKTLQCVLTQELCINEILSQIEEFRTLCYSVLKD